MVLQDKYKRANSSKYRATHGGIKSNRQIKAENRSNNGKISTNDSVEFPNLKESTMITMNQTTAGGNSLADDPVLEDIEAIDKITQDSHQSIIPPLTSNTIISSSSSSIPQFSRLPLKSNADRYLEPEPDPNQEPEPEVDLKEFIEKQKKRIEEKEEEEDQDIDKSFDHLFQSSNKHKINLNSKNHQNQNKKILIDDPNHLNLLKELDLERKKEEATRELIARFSGKKEPNFDSSNKNNERMNRWIKNREGNNNNNNNQKNNNLNLSLGSKSVDLIDPLEDEEFLDEVLNDSSGTYGKFKRRT